MEQTLAEAAQSGDLNALYELFRLDPTLLDKFDEPLFVDTPAHTAAAAGATHFAIEVLSLKPSFRMKLNPDGYSPLDLALIHGKKRTVERLIKHDPELIRVKGRERFTPLHYVAEVGDADLLADFLVACPESIKDFTIRGETAVHIAVRNIKVRALRVLLGWLERTKNEQILNWKDENGDTAFHVATSTNNFEVVRLLISRVKTINAKNLEGLTCLDTFLGLPITGDERIAKALREAGAKRSSSLRPVDTPADVLGSKKSFTEKVVRKIVGDDASWNNLSSEMQNALLVVCVLFVTATYQAVLSPPGGISSGGDTVSFPNISSHISSSSSFASMNSTTIYTGNATGKVQMSRKKLQVFILLNTSIFAASLFLIIRLLPKTLTFYRCYTCMALSCCYLISVDIIMPESWEVSLKTLFSDFGMFIGGVVIFFVIFKFCENQVLNRLRSDFTYVPN